MHDPVIAVPNFSERRSAATDALTGASRLAICLGRHPAYRAGLSASYTEGTRPPASKSEAISSSIPTEIVSLCVLSPGAHEPHDYELGGKNQEPRSLHDVRGHPAEGGK